MYIHDMYIYRESRDEKYTLYLVHVDILLNSITYISLIKL